MNVSEKLKKQAKTLEQWMKEYSGLPLPELATAETLAQQRSEHYADLLLVRLDVVLPLLEQAEQDCKERLAIRAEEHHNCVIIEINKRKELEGRLDAIRKHLLVFPSWRDAKLDSKRAYNYRDRVQAWKKGLEGLASTSTAEKAGKGKQP